MAHRRQWGDVSRPTRAHRKVERAHVMLNIRALALALEAKDTETSEHCRRVAQLSARLAVAAGWDVDRVMSLVEAGLLHDVGKLHIPNELLHKPARLTPNEYFHVKLHAEFGAQIAGQVLDAEQTRWIRHHHERWDGAGYPDGIQGEEIPVGALLIGLADAWDAMTHLRPHRAATRSPGEALTEAREQSGLQFAPWAVAALVQVWESGQLDPSAPLRRDPRALDALLERASSRWPRVSGRGRTAATVDAARRWVEAS